MYRETLARELAMHVRLSGRWLLASVVLVAGCVAGDQSLPLAPNLDISDAAHSGGTPGFYFLPPMVKQPTVSGVFDADIATRSPVVAICDVTVALDVDCGGSTPGATVPLRVFTTTSTPPITVDSDKYRVNWDTKEGTFSAGRTYRVHVRAGTPSRELGFADILLTDQPGQAKNLADDALIVLNDGRTLPIHFRIEVGAGPANEAPQVDAGADQTLTQPTTTLTGTATDDGQPSGTLTTAWSQVSGPGTVTFGDPSALVTTATVSAAGAYVLRLSASDGELTDEDDMVLAVGGATVNWTGAAGDFDWNTAGNWDAQRVPGPFDDVIVAAAGETPVSHGAGANAIQSLTVDGSAIALSGGTLTVTGNAAITSGVVTLAGGTLARAVVTGTGAVVALSGSGTLDGVTLGADVALTVPSPATLTLLNGLTLDGQLVLAGGEPFGVFARVEAVGNQTIGGSGTVQLAGTSNFNFLGAINPGTTLTLGPSLTVRGGGALLGNPGTQVANEGSILVGVGGPSIVTINGLANSGTLAVSNASAVFMQEAWTNSGGTIQLDNATMNLRGTVTTAGLGTWQRTGGTVNLNGTLTNTGATLDVDESGIGQIRISSGTIAGGTVVPGSVTTTPLTMSGTGTFDGVSLASGLTFTVSGQLTVRNGLTLDGQLVLTGSLSQVRADGTQAFGGGGEVVLDAAGSANAVFGTAGTDLTLGPSLTVRGTGVVQGGGLLINQGAIRGNVSGRSLSVSNLNNEGTVEATGGSTLALTGSLSNAGTIQLVDATINLGATVTAAGLGTWQRTNGTVNLVSGGTVTNTGTTLDVDAGGMGVLRLAGGTILGGTIVPGSGNATPLVLATGAAGTFDGVSLAPGLTVTVPAGATLTVRNGLTLDGQLSLVSVAGSAAVVNVAGTQTFGGSGQIVLSGPATLSRVAQSVSGATLTIGPSLTLRGTGAVTPTIGVAQLVNQGTIRADVPGQTLTLGALSNHGTIAAMDGAILTFTSLGIGTGSSTFTDGTIQVVNATVNLGTRFTTAGLGTWQRTGGTVNLVAQGTLTNTGATLDVDASGMGQLRLAGGTIVGGTVGPGSVTATPLVMGPGPSTLDGVTLAGLTLTVPGGANLRLVNGLTLNGNLIMTGAGSTAQVSSVGAQTLAGTGDIAMAGSGQNILGASSTGVLTIGPSITVHGVGTVGSVQGVINQGVIRADAAPGMTLTGFTNQASVEVANGASLTFAGSWTNAAGTLQLSDGTVNLGGAFTQAVFGTWQRTGGTVNLTGTLTNTGATLDVDASGIGAIRLAGGTILGGTVVPGSITATPLVMGPTGTLDGVTLASAVTLTVPGAATLTLRNGLTLDGNLVLDGLNSSTLRANVSIVGNQTISGIGDLILGSVSEHGSLLLGSGTVLTFGPSLTVRGAGIMGGNAIQLINLGTMRADVPGQPIRPGNLRNDGLIELPATGEIATLGSFTNGPGGTVTMEIAGAAVGQFGRIIVSGPTFSAIANLDGTLSVSLVGGFVPAAGDRFRFMTFSSRTGNFTTAALPPGFVLEAHATDLELVAP